jgi:hypothetical protein
MSSDEARYGSNAMNRSLEKSGTRVLVSDEIVSWGSYVDKSNETRIYG